MIERRRIVGVGGLLALALLATCDGDGCHGGPDGPATRSCQDALGRAGLNAAELPQACRQCCLQEVPYRGEIEEGRCVCRR